MARSGRTARSGPCSRVDPTRPRRHPSHVPDRSATTLTDLGLDIRQARKQRSWTQGQLAKNAAVAVSLVGRAERGQPVSDTTLKAIARTLDIPDTTIEPHLSETQNVATPARIEPATGTVADLRREFAYFHTRFRDTPEDYDRLLDLLDLYAHLQRTDPSTQGGLEANA